MTEYDVLLLGEQHNVGAHGDIEANIVRARDPDYVLIEAPYDEEITEKMDAYQSYRTLFDAEKSFYGEHGQSILPEDPSEILEDVLEELDQKPFIPCYTGVVPDTVDEYVTTPAYELNHWVAQRTAEAIEETVEEVTYQHRTSFGTVESEELKTANRILATYNEFAKAPLDRRTKFRFLDGIAEKVDDGETMLVPCDNRDLEQFDLSEYDLEEVTSGEADEQLEQDWEQRERFMSDVIDEYASDETPVVIVGANHLDRDSALLSRLRKNGVQYQAVHLHPEKPYGRTTDKLTTQ